MEQPAWRVIQLTIRLMGRVCNYDWARMAGDCASKANKHVKEFRNPTERFVWSCGSHVRWFGLMYVINESLYAPCDAESACSSPRGSTRAALLLGLQHTFRVGG
jgi:hypothetical protein